MKTQGQWNQKPEDDWDKKTQCGWNQQKEGDWDKIPQATKGNLYNQLLYGYVEIPLFGLY